MTEAQSEGGRPRHFVLPYFDTRMSRELCGNPGGEFITVYRESASCGELMPIGRLHNERASAAHLLVQKADGVRFPVIGPERIRADEFCAVAGFMGLGQARGAHLVENNVGSSLGGLPSRFRPRKACSYHVECSLFCHGRKVGENPCTLNVKPCVSVGSDRRAIDFLAIG